MTDREVLLIAYGALKTMENQVPDLIFYIEQHLYGEKTKTTPIYFEEPAPTVELGT